MMVDLEFVEWKRRNKYEIHVIKYGMHMKIITPLLGVWYGCQNVIDEHSL